MSVFKAADAAARRLAAAIDAENEIAKDIAAAWVDTRRPPSEFLLTAYHRARRDVWFAREAYSRTRRTLRTGQAAA